MGCFGKKNSKTVACLQITLKNGTLKDVASCFQNDPIVHFMLNKKSYRSGYATIKGTKPVWGKLNAFDFKVKKTDKDITVFCKHHVNIFPNKLIGYGYLDVTQYTDKEGQYSNQTIRLLDSNDQQVGTLNVDIFVTLYTQANTDQNSQYHKPSYPLVQKKIQQNQNMAQLQNQNENIIQYTQSKQDINNQQVGQKEIIRQQTITPKPNQSLAQQKYIEQNAQIKNEKQQQYYQQNEYNKQNKEILNTIDDAELARQLDMQYKEQLNSINHKSIDLKENYNINIDNQVQNNDLNVKNPIQQQSIPSNKYDYPVE
ncbi:C2 domain [Pseudocohnilembus persalinus]|uniref:C2 domain n=1 Tax=Pseudocohnilembus persalinus TaxID=266149 RepID=A0A0V0QSX1_PSEPJ|nr:C2 domain [Pseudocohnilembus persalinus]|eukprot:KRX05029.1 C2 domain [Pseudocohnilembus persalinus]